MNDEGELDARPVTRIGKDEIVALLNGRNVSCVVADMDNLFVGPPARRFTASGRMKRIFASPTEMQNALHFKNYPEEFCYLATAWGLTTRSVIVALEKIH